MTRLSTVLYYGFLCSPFALCHGPRILVVILDTLTDDLVCDRRLMCSFRVHNMYSTDFVVLVWGARA